MKPLPCPHCHGAGIVERDYGAERVYHEPCDACDGRGVQMCVETGCTEPATHIFTERDQTYPLCEIHHAKWKADADA